MNEPTIRNYTVFPEMDPTEPDRVFVLREDGGQHSFTTSREAQTWIANSLETDGHKAEVCHEIAKAVVQLVVKESIVMKFSIDSH